MDHIKTKIWDLHPVIMNLFRQNPTLIELEETLDTVKEYFGEEAKKEFKDWVDEIDILNKNGHFAYVCSRMDYYKDLEKRMDWVTGKINKARARAKALVQQLTDFTLNEEFLLKMLAAEFEKRHLQVASESNVQSSANPEKVDLLDSQTFQQFPSQAQGKSGVGPCTHQSMQPPSSQSKVSLLNTYTIFFVYWS